MSELILSIMNNFGYLGISVLMFVENLFPPIPSEIVLGFGGFMTTRTTMTRFGVIASATLGVLAGNILLYTLGTKLTGQKMSDFVDRYGKKIGVSSADAKRALAFYTRHEDFSVFLCRMIPGMRSLISIPAGMAGIKPLRFLLLSGLGTVLWNTVLVFVSASLGENWKAILGILDTYSYVVYVLFVILGIYFFYRLWKRKKRRNSVNKKL